jgi:hypothetical protein
LEKIFRIPQILSTMLSRKNEQITECAHCVVMQIRRLSGQASSGGPAFPPAATPSQGKYSHSRDHCAGAGLRYAAAMIAAYPRRLPRIDGIAPLPYKRPQLSDIPPETAAGDPGRRYCFI